MSKKNFINLIVLLKIMSIKKWFKSKPCWLRGGMIGILIPPISGLLIILSNIASSLDFIGETIALGFLLLNVWLCAFYETCWNSQVVWASLGLAVIEFFIIGVAIGWIVGKIKSKKVE